VIVIDASAFLEVLLRSTSGLAVEALLCDAPIERVPYRELFTTARRFGPAMSSYDALYAAFAASLRCPLVTTDGRLARIATTQFSPTVTHVPTSGR
jgi:predicted nucleic acid-binding protein